MEFPKHTAYEFLVESGLHDQADELMELMEKQEALEAKDDGAGAGAGRAGFAPGKEADD